MRTMRKKIVCMLGMLGLLAMGGTLAGCSFFQLHRPIIEQGNIIEQKTVNQLRPGMTPAQVVHLMGTPVLTNLLSVDHMEYIYTYQDGRTKRKTQVSCLFVHGRLHSIQQIGAGS